MKCKNPIHNRSWTVTGTVSPCNNIINWPKFYSVDEMENSQAYQNLISDHATDIESSYCQRCWDKESLGIPSKRQTDNTIAEIYTKLNPNFIKIDAAIGDICNAACRICDNDSSSLWQQLNKKFYEITVEKETVNNLWPYVNNNLENILQFDFGGGEPWLNSVEQQIEVFEKLIQSGQSRRVKLRYNTNGSIRPRSLLEKFQYFREVEITLSIDDIKERFEYNRYPLKWANVLENIKYLQTLKNTILTINYSVSVFSFYYAQEFLSWANANGLTRVNWNIITEPAYYSIKSLPLRVQQALDPTQLFYNIVSSNPMPNWEEKFKSITQELDQQRGQVFCQVFPELDKLY